MNNNNRDDDVETGDFKSPEAVAVEAKSGLVEFTRVWQQRQQQQQKSIESVDAVVIMLFFSGSSGMLSVLMTDDTVCGFNRVQLVEMVGET